MSDFQWGEAGKGAAGGAMTGAAIGSLAGPYGTVIGAGVGGIAGGLYSGFGWGGDEETDQESLNRKMMMDYYAELQRRPTETAGPAQQGKLSDFRSNQSGLISRLEAMANGTGPSLAKQQFEQATDRNMRGQQAMAASGRGGPLAQLTAANNMGMLGASAAQGSALARTNEQMQSIGQLGGVINQARSGDESMSQFNAGQQNSFQLANLDARLRQMGMSHDARLKLLGQTGQLNQNQAGRPTSGDRLLAGGAGAYSFAQSQNSQNTAKPQMSTIAAGNPGAGGYYTPTAAQAPQQQNNVDLFNYNRSTIGQGGWGGQY